MILFSAKLKPIANLMRFAIRIAVVAGAFVLGVAIFAAADSQVRIVRISFLDHLVQVSRPWSGGAEGAASSAERWAAAMLNAPVVESEKIRTAAGGEAEVQLECGSALRLAPNSEFDFASLRLHDNGVRRTVVKVESGTAFFAVRRSDSQEFAVELPGGVQVSTPDGAASFRVDADAAGSADVQLTSGRIKLQSGKQTETIKKAERLQLLPGGGMRRGPLAPPDQWAQWSHNRDMQFQRAIIASEAKPLMDAATPAPSAGTLSGVPAPQPSIALNSDVFTDMDNAAGVPDPAAGAPAARTVPYCARN